MTGFGQAYHHTAAILVAAAADDKSLAFELAQLLTHRGAAQAQQVDEVTLAHLAAQAQQTEDPLTAARGASAMTQVVITAAHESSETVTIRLGFRRFRVRPTAPAVRPMPVRTGTVVAVGRGRSVVRAVMTERFRTRGILLGDWPARAVWSIGLRPEFILHRGITPLATMLATAMGAEAVWPVAAVVTVRIGSAVAVPVTAFSGFGADAIPASAVRAVPPRTALAVPAMVTGAANIRS